MDLLKIIDKSNGYVFRGIEGNINEFNKLAAAPTKWDYDRYPFTFRVFFKYQYLRLIVGTPLLLSVEYAMLMWDRRNVLCLNMGLSSTTMAIQEKYMKEGDGDDVDN